jgi:uncharacterized protein YeaO (DUF488 family)
MAKYIQFPSMANVEKEWKEFKTKYSKYIHLNKEQEETLLNMTARPLQAVLGAAGSGNKV